MIYTDEPVYGTTVKKYKYDKSVKYFKNIRYCFSLCLKIPCSNLHMGSLM